MQNEYETHKLVETFGFPNIWYPELKFNFIRPRFLRTIKDFVRSARFTTQLLC
jgi:hypothetical protein